MYYYGPIPASAGHRSTPNLRASRPGSSHMPHRARVSSASLSGGSSACRLTPGVPRPSLRPSSKPAVPSAQNTRTSSTSLSSQHSRQSSGRPVLGRENTDGMVARRTTLVVARRPGSGQTSMSADSRARSIGYGSLGSRDSTSLGSRSHPRSGHSSAIAARGSSNGPSHSSPVARGSTSGPSPSSAVVARGPKGTNYYVSSEQLKMLHKSVSVAKSIVAASMSSRPRSRYLIFPAK